MEHDEIVKVGINIITEIKKTILIKGKSRYYTRMNPSMTSMRSVSLLACIRKEQ